MSHYGRRPRADTRTILGDQWVAQVEEEPRPVNQRKRLPPTQPIG